MLSEDVEDERKAKRAARFGVEVSELKRLNSVGKEHFMKII